MLLELEIMKPVQCSMQYEVSSSYGLDNKAKLLTTEEKIKLNKIKK